MINMETRAIVKEPYSQYQVKPWYSTGVIYDFDLGIIRIDDEKIFVKQNSLKIQMPLAIEKRVKISSLRGKLKNIEERQIDEKLSKLREEWERDF